MFFLFEQYTGKKDFEIKLTFIPKIKIFLLPVVESWKIFSEIRGAVGRTNLVHKPLKWNKMRLVIYGYLTDDYGSPYSVQKNPCLAKIDFIGKNVPAVSFMKVLDHFNFEEAWHSSHPYILAEPFIFRTWNDNLYGEFLPRVTKCQSEVVQVQCALVLKSENVSAVRYPGIVGRANITNKTLMS